MGVCPVRLAREDCLAGICQEIGMAVIVERVGPSIREDAQSAELGRDRQNARVENWTYEHCTTDDVSIRITLERVSGTSQSQEWVVAPSPLKFSD